MTVASASGLYLPVVFAIATGIPVIVFAWIIAYTISGIGGAYNKIKIFNYGSGVLLLFYLLLSGFII